jgi:hypothetical protein
MRRIRFNSFQTKNLLLSCALLFALTTGYSGKPHLSFFCELQGKEFNQLFNDSALIHQLVEMQVSVRIGLHDFSPERTQTIQKLNNAGVPIVAWLLLSEEEGYWFNMHNADKAEKRYDEFKEWTARNHLKWEGIGIDLEPDMKDIRLALNHPWKLAWRVYKRLYDNESLKKGKEQYQQLISRMKSDGYTVESYLISVIYEERAKNISSGQKLMGIVDIKTDKEIPMLYSSMMNNPGNIPLYLQKNMPVGLGSTGGGVKIEGVELASLSWESLERDLLVASKLTGDIHIFCLETSVQKGFLTKIQHLDFDQKAPDISLETKKQSQINSKLRTVLILLNYPFWLTVSVFVIISGIFFGFYKLIVFCIRWVKKSSQ